MKSGKETRKNYSKNNPGKNQKTSPTREQPEEKKQQMMTKKWTSKRINLLKTHPETDRNAQEKECESSRKAKTNTKIWKTKITQNLNDSLLPLRLLYSAFQTFPPKISNALYLEYTSPHEASTSQPPPSIGQHSKLCLNYQRPSSSLNSIC